MCLLCYTEEGATPDWYGLETACLNNPDGFGWTLHLGDSLLVGRSMDSTTALEGYYDALKKHGPVQSMFHARWATHGTTSLDNCHPFEVGRASHTVLAHNGILPLTPGKGDPRSDTAMFAQDILPKRGIKMLDKRKRRKELEAWLGGSKVVVFTTLEKMRRSAYILNEELGHWDGDGTWWSNDSYKTRYSWTLSNEPEDIGDVTDMDKCYVCGDYVSAADASTFGYCMTCESCLDCMESFNNCICYAPESMKRDTYQYESGYWYDKIEA